jgi:hypothetical protein
MLHEQDHRLRGNGQQEAEWAVGPDSCTGVKVTEFLDQEADAHANVVKASENAAGVSPWRYYCHQGEVLWIYGNAWKVAAQGVGDLLRNNQRMV